MRLRAAVFAACLPGLALAQEFVEADGPMSDDDFYNAVACGADPGGECRKPLVRWEREGRPIRIAVRQIDEVYLGGKKLRAAAALERAIQALNGADAGFRVVEVDAEADAEIEIFFFDLERGEAIAGTGIEGVDGSPLGGASTRVLFERETGRIRQVAIVFSTTLEIRAYESVMLEELTQSMGLMTDIRNPYYDETSIFSQDTNASTELGEQDIMALKRHYAER
ncbi:MAG: DUF2927 domain-containing protein [Pseudomonadota bacterium]|nr:DUF2927 domain-containing protein [Pseudomonadota bacterium]